MVWYGDLIMAEFKDDAVVERVRASRRRIVKRCGGGTSTGCFAGPSGSKRRIKPA
jgi:hypothetical protein